MSISTLLGIKKKIERSGAAVSMLSFLLSTFETP
jgi:hypothetical protein